MEFSVTDNEGRSVSVNADNWLFAAASAFKALGVDLDTLSRLDCILDAEEGTMQIDMPSIARSWVVRRAEPVVASSDLPWDTPTVLASPIQALPEPTPGPLAPPEPEPLLPPPPQGVEGVVPAAPTKTVPVTNPAPIDTALGAVPTAPPPPEPHREPQPTMIPPDDMEDSPEPAPAREAAPEVAPPVPTPAPPTRTQAPQPAPEPVAAAPRVTPTPAPPTRRDPELKIVISSRSQKLEDEEPDAPVEPEKIDLSVPPPSLHMPVTSTLEREPQESLAERLFDLSMDLVTAEPDEACDMALQLVLEFVPCEAASVIRGTLNDDALRFVSVSGPVAAKLKGRTLPFGEGLVGMCFDMRATMHVPDVNESVAHVNTFDAETGFSTLAALCVPILDDEGLVYGVIELLNPTDRSFLDEDEEAVETIARTLAGALAIH